MNKAVFLDRDGTLIEDRHYQFRTNNLQLLEGVTDGLRALKNAGYRLVVITNQSGVARGYYDEAQVQAVHNALQQMLAEQGVQVDAFYYCPHHVEGQVEAYAVDCDCRKPKPGMLLQAANDQGLDLAQSWMIGDIDDDVKAGQKAGCRTVLIDRTSKPANEDRHTIPTHTVTSFTQATQMILNHRQGEAHG
jgi:D,D-heptose 1,7-bisphosphate phosphatase